MAHGQVWDEAVHGDLSNDEAAPSVVPVSQGSNFIRGQVGGGDSVDAFTITFGPGTELSQIVLNTLTPGGDTSSFRIYAATGADVLMGATFIESSDVGRNVLSDMLGPLAPGQFTFRFSKGGAAQTYELDFVVGSDSGMGTPPTDFFISEFCTSPTASAGCSQTQPAEAVNCATLEGARVFGGMFESGMTATLSRAGEPDIVGTITFASPGVEFFRVDFPLNGAAPGLWDLTAIRQDGASSTLVNALEVLPCPPPTLASVIEPSPATVEMTDAQPMRIRVRGTDLFYGAAPSTVEVKQGGVTYASAIGVKNHRSVGDTDVYAVIDLTEAPLGLYDIVVTRSDEHAATLTNGLEVVVRDGGPVFASGWGGAVNAVDVVGNRAYVGAGQRLVVLGISNPASPVELGSVNLLSPVQDLKVQGGHAFVATRSTPYPFCVVDVSDAADPRLIWFEPTSQIRSPSQVQLHGNLAYVRDDDDLVVYDITEPANPALHPSDLIQSWVETFEIVGDRLYAAGDVLGDPLNDVLRIYDLAVDPLNPILLGETPLDMGALDPTIVDTPLDISVEGGLACVVNRETENGGNFRGTYRMRVVDVSDPAAPALVGTYSRLNAQNLDGQLASVTLSGGMAYVTQGLRTSNSGDATPQVGQPPRASTWELNDALLVIDVASNPSFPLEVGTFDTRSNATHGSVVAGDTAYLMDGGEGLVLVDISTPSSPQRLGSYYSPSILRRMAKDGDLLYVTDMFNGFTILDVSDASAPSVVGRYLTQGMDGTTTSGGLQNHWGIKVAGGVAYFSAGFGGFETVDVSSPASPSRLDVFSIPDGARVLDVDVTGAVAHVATDRGSSSANGMYRALDITSPSGIVELGSAFWNRIESEVLIAAPDGRTVYGVKHSRSNLEIIDVSTPALPVASGLNFGVGEDLALSGTTLFAAHGDNDADGGLRTFDVSNPLAPALLTHVSFNQAPAIAVHENLVYIVGNPCSLGFPCGPSVLVFDVTDPAAPGLVHVVDDLGALALRRSDNGDLLADGQNLYLLTGLEGSGGQDEEHGLIIFRVGTDARCPADLDGSGDVDVFDLLAYLDMWFAADPAADVDGVAGVDVFDLLSFLDDWFAGCP